MIHAGILTDYDSHAGALNGYGRALEERFRRLLEKQKLKIHSVSRRLKPRDSFRHKVSRPDKTYLSLWEVTDVLGLRVTTYFEDSIEEVARLVESHFDVDFSHSTDKIRHLDPRRFGYRSVHYVCRINGSLPGISIELPAEARFEIQIRTVLQHAWAEIEHDLGYKANDAVPENVRRRFSRIASLLEVADEEFVSIRRELKRYESAVREAVMDPAQPLSLDRVSLDSFVRDPGVARADDAIALLLGKPLSDEIFFPEYLVRMLHLAGLPDTGAIREALGRHEARVVEIVPPYFDFARAAWKLTASHLDCVHRGYSLFFLSHVAIVDSPILELNKIGKLAQLYRELDYPDDERSAHEVASQLISLFKRAP